MFILKLLSKEDGENYGQFCKYELIKHRLYVGVIENASDGLTKNNDLIKFWRNYQAELVCNKITVPGTVSKMFQNKRFKMPTYNLQSPGETNDR